YAWGHPKSLDQRDDVRNCSISPPYLPVTAVNTTARLTALRQQMYTQNLSAYIVPDTDAHMSEYIGEYDQRRVWITGFTGSAGVAVVTMGKASLWTDSRYWTQAERQMDCNWELHKEVGTTPVVTWLLTEIPVGARVGVDPFLFSIDSWESYDVALQDYDRELVSITVNLVDLVWGSERPPVPNEPIYALQEAFTGSTWQEKVTGIRSQMQKHHEAPTAVLLSALDETAWLFNLRGSDIPYNPFFYSYTLLTDSSIRLFANKSRFSSETLQYLNSGCTGPLCVQVEDYGQVRDSVQAYTSGDVKVWIGTSYTSYGLYEVIPKEKLLADTYSPVMVTKAVKNSKEQTLLRASHVRDAVAVIRYLVWLEKNVPQGTVDEFSGAEQLEKFRGGEDFFSGSSFETISASGLNAALAHYSPTKELHRKLSSDEMYLLDSGGQYCQESFPILYPVVNVLMTKALHWEPAWQALSLAAFAVTTPSGAHAEDGNCIMAAIFFPWPPSPPHPSPATQTPHSLRGGKGLHCSGSDEGWSAGGRCGDTVCAPLGPHSCIQQPLGLRAHFVAFSPSGGIHPCHLFCLPEPGYYLDGEFGIRLEDVALVVEAKTKPCPKSLVLHAHNKYQGSLLGIKILLACISEKKGDVLLLQAFKNKTRLPLWLSW
ncbi:hypothetical protein FD754_021854, partial [Muntiacus muntjak]